MSPVGTFETCPPILRMSVHRGRPEVAVVRPNRRDGPQAEIVRPQHCSNRKLPISSPAEKDQSPKVQTDTRRTRLRTCTSNSSSVISWTRAVIGLSCLAGIGRMYAQIMVKVGRLSMSVATRTSPGRRPDVSF
jgi:hypothetical protein